jgi:cytoskeletal protein CcmA (bactofilin family)
VALFGKAPDSKSNEPAPAPPPPAAPAASRTGTCVIGSKTTVKGEISGDEDVLVEGAVEGQVRIAKELRVGAGGVVRATVEAQSVLVSGEIVGDVTAAARVEIQATGRLTGNIKAPRIVIAEGALFKGTSDMTPGPKKEAK